MQRPSHCKSENCSRPYDPDEKQQQSSLQPLRMDVTVPVHRPLFLFLQISFGVKFVIRLPMCIGTYTNADPKRNLPPGRAPAQVSCSVGIPRPITSSSLPHSLEISLRPMCVYVSVCGAVCFSVHATSFLRGRWSH